MSRNNNKSKGISGWTILATVVGLGIRYGMNKLI